jgi:hypothetical protein
MDNSRGIRVLVLFVILGSGVYFLLSSFYEDSYRFFETKENCELYLPEGATKISFYKSGEDWLGYFCHSSEVDFRDWVKNNPYELTLPIKKGPASVSYYNKAEEGLTYKNLKSALLAMGNAGGRTHYFIYDLGEEEAYYYNHKE